MTVYMTVINWAGSLDNEIEGFYWDKDAAIRSAKEIIADDERGRDDEDDYEVYWVDIATQVADDNGSFRTIKTEKIEHEQH